MKRRWIVAVAAGCVLVSSGCAFNQSVRENREISRLIRKDIIDYYENMSQAYMLLGFGFIRCYNIAKEQNDEVAAKQYWHDAMMYKSFSDDLKATVKIWRKDYGLDEETELSAEEEPAPTPAGEQPEPASTAEEPALSEVGSPQPTPVAPQQKRSILDRLMFWRNKEE